MERLNPDADDSDDDGLHMPQNQVRNDVIEQVESACSFPITEDGEGVLKLMKNCSDAFVVDTAFFAEGWANNMQDCINKGRSLNDVWAEAAYKTWAEMVTESRNLAEQNESNVEVPIISTRMLDTAARMLGRYWVNHGKKFYQAYSEVISINDEVEPTTGSTSDIIY